MPGTLDELNCVSPTPTTSSADGTHDSRDFKDYSGRSWSRDSRSSSALDRRSESSESLDNHSTSSGHGRHLRDFGSTEFIPTRSTKSTAKPAYNPMQFVKTGPAKLVLTAQEQLKKAEEMKKMREKKKDESEDWQSNLEGWKSNRRKRQEHVIERVTEVKRMEQEEALRASEAAAKRLMEMREKRGKLTALYSTEDNDEIEFGNMTTVSEEKSSKDQENGNANDQHIMNNSDQAASHSHKSRDEEYTYDKAIEDYVKYTNTALSKNEVTEIKSNEIKSSKTSSSTENKELVIKRSQKIEAKTQALLENTKPNEQRERKSISPENGDAVVKRRSMFERATTSEEKELLRANRRSGEFSSTFKNRLSNFELGPSTNSSTRVIANRDPEFRTKLASFQSTESLVERRPSPTKDEEENDSKDFKTKLAAFRKAEQPVSIPPTRKSAERQVDSKPLVKQQEAAETESVNKLEVSNHKEQEIISTVDTKPYENSVHQHKSEEINLQPEPEPESVQSKPKPIPPNPLPKPESLIGKPKVFERKISLPKTSPEPIYANTTIVEQPTLLKDVSNSMDPKIIENGSVVLNKPNEPVRNAGIGMPENRQIVPDYGEILSRPAEESDCTEDEGIRSLSPHGTQSPTSPTNIEADSIQPEPMTFPTYYPLHSQVNQAILSKDSLDSMEDKTDSGHLSYPAEDASFESSAQSSEVWGASDWLVGVVPNVSPPSEKPPPPPSDEDQQTDIQQVILRNQGSDPRHRKELRKRRSDFLGFDVENVNDITALEASAIPPPPDLKSLLRNSDIRSGEVPMFADMEPEQSFGKAIPDEDELARKEREIIEILEKEEYEQLHSGMYPADSQDTMNREHMLQGIEYEMNAEIDQLAREWQGKKVYSSLKSQQKSTFPGNRYKEQNTETAVSSTISTSLETESVKPIVPDRSLPDDVDSGLTRTHISNKPRYQEPESSNKRLSETNSTDGGRFQGIANSKPVSQETESVRRSLPPLVQHRQETEGHPVSFPIKPSRLSAAPKPRLHDGETWMAKRKVAVEGQRKEKDISRHWLIQEAEQRRIDAMQERNQVPPERNSNPNNVPSHWASMPSVAPTRNVAVAPPAQTEQWLPRSSSSTSMDKVPEPRLQSKDYSRSTSSLASSPTPRPLYANQEEILEYADFTNAETGPQVWQVRSLNSGSMDHLQNIAPPARPCKTQSKSVTHLAQPNPTQTQPTWRSTQPPEMDKEPIAPLPHSVIHTLTQRVAQKNNANYGDYMNIQEATMPSRAGPQVPAQRPANYRHSPLINTQSAPNFTNNPQSINNNNDRMLSVSGKKKCSLCQEELGRGAAMIIESLRLFYHIACFRCCVCGVALGNGTAGTDVRVRNNHLHCHDCYSNDEGLKFSKV